MAVVNLLLPAFGIVWAQDGTVEAIEEAQWRAGWAFIGATPPSVEQFNKVMQIQDQKANWLYQQMLAVFTAAGETPTVGDLTSLRDSLNGMYGRGRLLGIRVLTNTQVYTPTTGTGAVDIEFIGSGGGGGGAPNTGAGAQAAGGGGGAGGYGRKYLTTGFAGALVTIGNPGVGVLGAAGTAGQASSFGALMTIGGGSGGALGITRTAANYSSGAAGGGTVSNADFGTAGQVGGIGIVFAGGGVSGNGANTPLGSGGVGVAADSTIATPGNDGAGFGSGGSGGTAVNSGSAPRGGDGTRGICIIKEYSA